MPHTWQQLSAGAPSVAARQQQEVEKGRTNTECKHVVYRVCAVFVFHCWSQLHVWRVECRRDNSHSNQTPGWSLFFFLWGVVFCEILERNCQEIGLWLKNYWRSPLTVCICISAMMPVFRRSSSKVRGFMFLCFRVIHLSAVRPFTLNTVSQKCAQPFKKKKKDFN